MKPTRSAALVALLLLSAVFLLAGCISHGPAGSLHHVADQASAATFVIIRPSRFVGAAGNVMATLDGWDIFGLGNGEYVSVPSAPGEHLVGVAYRFDVVDTVSVTGRRYYFQIDVTLSGVRINRITPEAGERLMAETEPQKINPERRP